jgi:hypothetical protein
MASMVLGDSTLEALAPSVNAPHSTWLTTYVRGVSITGKWVGNVTHYYVGREIGKASGGY